MILTELLKEKEITAYRLSKDTGIAEATISNIVNDKLPIEKISSGALHKIASYLNVPMELFFNEKLKRKPNPKLANKKVPNEFKSTFWDTNISLLDLDKDKDYIIPRMYCKGGVKGWKWVETTYPEDDIIIAIKTSRDLNPMIANHLKEKYHLKESDMVYYSFNNEAWGW